MVEFSAFALGLAIGALGIWALMDRRLQRAREERDRAMDRDSIVARRPPVTSVVRKELAEQEDRERKAMKQDRSLFGEFGAEEVGTEPDDDGTKRHVNKRDERAPAGIDRTLLEK